MFLGRFMLMTVCAMLLFGCSADRPAGNALPMREVFTLSTYVYDEAADAYVLAPLVLHEERELPRVGDGIGANYHLYLTYEPGLCQTVAEEKDVQLSLGFWETGDLGETRTYGYDLTLAREGYVVLLPFSGLGYFNWRDDPQGWTRKADFRSHTGREFFLTVNALDSFGTVMASARLRLVQQADPSAKDEDTSGRFTIEMIAFAYSDAYKLMEGAE